MRVVDREDVRSLLDADPVHNAVVWNRVFQQAGYEVYTDGDPPRGVLAVQRVRRPGRPNFLAMHALDSEAAGRLSEGIPSGGTVIHLTDEFPLALLAARAEEFRPHPAWLFRLDPADFVDVLDPQVRPLTAEGARRVAKFWEPGWPAEGYIRRRIEAGPTAAVFDGATPIAWALTHMVTDRVGLIGMVHVVEEHRRKGLARAVVAAVSRDLLANGKIPALHAFVENTASLALFPSLGFRKVTRQVWGDAVFL